MSSPPLTSIWCIQKCAKTGVTENFIMTSEVRQWMKCTMQNDELDAVHAYNNAIKLAREIDDQGTVDLLTKILKMEEVHVEWAEIQRTQIEQMGIENYLINQIDSQAN